MRNGQVYEHQTLAHPIAVNGSLSWQTPATFQGKYRRQIGQTERAELLLPGQAQNWQTPSANEDAAGTINGNMQHMLSHQVQEVTGITSPNDTGQRLNPLFVEWLMGWPEGWLELSSFVSSETESFHNKPQPHFSTSGDG